MTSSTAARPRVPASAPTAVRQLARLEGWRMLRNPASWIGLAVTVWSGAGVFEQNWAGAHYQGLMAAVTPLLLGVTVASISAFAREHVPISDEAPVGRSHRALGRFVGGLALVALVAAVVAATTVWLRVRGGLVLGDEPGRTAHAYYTLPELLQPVVLAAFAVALGAALVQWLRHPLAASVVAFVAWFLLGPTYWLFNTSVLQWLTPVQVQPVHVEVGPAATDPMSFPADWLLSVPGEYQEQWVRLVVSPALAAWHDVYLVALTVLLGAAVVPGRYRRAVVAGAVLLAAVAVLMQRSVMP
jgi:hypothetical protein